MLPIVISFAGLILGGLSLWGWGSAVERLLRRPAYRWPLTVTLGFAVMILAGGFLNLARLARPWALDALLAVGIVAAGVGLWVHRGSPRPKLQIGAIVPAIPWLLVAGFVAACLIPASAYNIHDDLEKYFALPVRMLSTGTLAPNPLSSVGAETLGAQAFLDAFLAAHFPLVYLEAVDAWFCLLLFLAVVAYGWPASRLGIAAAAAVFCGWVIDPMIVNIASLFSGAALIAAAIFFGARIGGPEPAGRDGLPLGLAYGALIALKPTFAVFVVLHAASLLLVSGRSGPRRWTWLPWGMAGAIGSVLPWFLLHLPLYLSPVHAGAGLPPGPSEKWALFSREVSGYGTTQFSYTILALAALAAAVYATWRLRPAPAHRASALTAIAATGYTAAAAYVIFVVIGGPRLFGPYGATRYVCPVLIAAIPCIMRLLESPDPRHSRVTDGIMLAVAFGTALLFLPATAVRPEHWWHDRTPLAFLSTATPIEREDYRTYNRQVFGGLTQSNLEWVQSLVPAGEPLGAWVTTPFLLDFQRNPLFDAEPAGLSQRWTHWPDGVRYFLLEQSGFAVRTVEHFRATADHSTLPINRFTAVRTLEFLDDLRKRSASAKVVYNDGRYVLWHLPP